MKFGLFYELQLPRPWAADSEHRLIQEALKQIELADEIGIDCVWAVEHHFLEEYSHCSAPEVFLAAASQRTKQMRLGHGIVVTPPQVNHPARVAERIAMLDQVSSGRVEFGSGESTTDHEMDAFQLSREQKRAAWEEGLRAIVGMLADDVFPGVEGRYVSFPRRGVIPKPFQRPHPPLWLACSHKARIADAARLGLGALNFSFGVQPELASKYVETYYGQIAEGMEPIGRAVNANFAVVAGFVCAADQREVQAGFDAMRFFVHAIGYYFTPGQQIPEPLDIAGSFGTDTQVKKANPDAPASLGIFATPDGVRDSLQAYEASGIDQITLVAQAGGLPHEAIMASLRRFGREVVPEFKAREEAARVDKQRRLLALGLSVPAGVAV